MPIQRPSQRQRFSLRETTRKNGQDSSVCTAGRRRRRQCHSVVLSAVVALTLVSARAFVVVPKSASSACSSRATFRISALKATTNQTDTWSRTGGGEGSRFGVRKRVRRVLEKARNRTGRSNFSVLAETASIGGLDDKTNLILIEDDSIDEMTAFLPQNGTEITLEPLRTQKRPPSTAVPTSTSSVDVDALLASEEAVIDPLPFRLPTLSDDQQQRLDAGERVQEQSKMGREGSGFIVLDVDAPPYIVWECLLDFEQYPNYISTVRSMSLFTNNYLTSSYLAEKPILPEAGRSTRHYGKASISRASFVLSKFRLKIAAVHRYQPHPVGHYMVFTLDRACKNVVLKDAKGIWYTQEMGDKTRIWLLCDLKVSSLLPSVIVDYVAERAMPRATNWLRPTVEEKRKELLEKSGQE